MECSRTHEPSNQRNNQQVIPTPVFALCRADQHTMNAACMPSQAAVKTAVHSAHVQNCAVAQTTNFHSPSPRRQRRPNPTCNTCTTHTLRRDCQAEGRGGPYHMLWGHPNSPTTVVTTPTRQKRDACLSSSAASTPADLQKPTQPVATQHSARVEAGSNTTARQQHSAEPTLL